MPDAFDPANIPAEFAHSSQLAEEQLTKLAASDQKVLGSESSTLNLLSRGLTSQAKVLNSLVDKLGAFELRQGQELGNEVQQQFNRHVTLTRKLQKKCDSNFTEGSGPLARNSQYSTDMLPVHRRRWCGQYCTRNSHQKLTCIHRRRANNRN